MSRALVGYQVHLVSSAPGGETDHQDTRYPEHHHHTLQGQIPKQCVELSGQLMGELQATVG